MVSARIIFDTHFSVRCLIENIRIRSVFLFLPYKKWKRGGKKIGGEKKLVEEKQLYEICYFGPEEVGRETKITVISKVRPCKYLPQFSKKNYFTRKFQCFLLMNFVRWIRKKNFLKFVPNVENVPENFFKFVRARIQGKFWKNFFRMVQISSKIFTNLPSNFLTFCACWNVPHGATKII